MPSLTQQERDILAMTIAGEIDARYSPYGTPENRDEIAAILSTIDNRYTLDTPGAFGKTGGRSNYSTRADVALQPMQYSTWNDAHGRAVAQSNLERYSKEIYDAIEDWEAGYLVSKVPDATHYWAPKTMDALYGKPNPSWANSILNQTFVGPHVFGYTEKTPERLDAAREFAVNPPVPTPAPSQTPGLAGAYSHWANSMLAAPADPISRPATAAENYTQAANTMLSAGVPGLSYSPPATFAAPVEPVVTEALAPAGLASIAPAGTPAPSLAPAPVESVISGGALAAPPTPTSPANAYAQLADTMSQVGVTGLSGTTPTATPTVPDSVIADAYQYAGLTQSLAPADPVSRQTVSVEVPAIGVPDYTATQVPSLAPAPANSVQQSTVPNIAPSVTTSVPTVPSVPAVTAPSINTAPAVPTPSATPAAPKSEGPSLGSRLGHAAIGGAIGGLPGAVIGGLFGPAITSTAKDVLGGVGKSLGLNSNTTPSTSSKSTGTGLGGFLGGLGDVFSGQSNITMPESTYSVGKGVDAIGGVFSGAFGPGATAISLGNPNVSFTDLGNGNVAKVNSELGTTSLVNASSFNWSGGTQGGGKSNSASSWGLGDVFGGLGDAVSDAFSGWGGDASTSSSYSGPNSTTDPSDSW